ncbi:hypothetical protein HAHE_22790 [Haloferula helveola]|uniref:Thioredoxin domain-containing protein n=1 Tax=Haloferula helveola TaxID=490095 RepID=A0ABM7RMJ6_9BACT|nr:hypothetical protein HAHE_22790 [Haloferula helveola]
MTHRFLSAALGVWVALSGATASAALKVGDRAPKIAPGKWAQGEPVGELEGDKVYIVEFWATWCGPCIAAIPHVNDLSKKHSGDGLVVVGQNLGEDEATVTGFVRKMGSKMTYRVAVDDAAGTMSKTWLKAAGQSGIPCAFVVNKKGKVAYIGHPMRLEESFIKKLLAEEGTAPAPKEAPVAAAPSEKAKALEAKATELLAAGKPEEAAPVIAELHEELADGFRHIGGLMELDLMIARKQHADAVALAGILAEDFSAKPEVVLGVAKRLAAATAATPSMLDAATGLAQPLSSGDGPQKSGALEVLASVAFRQNDRERAVSLQKQAVECADASQAAAAREVLQAYEDGRQP